MPPKIFNKFAKSKPHDVDGGEDSNETVVKQEVQAELDDINSTAFDQQRDSALVAHEQQKQANAAAANQGQQKKPPPKKPRTVLAVTQASNRSSNNKDDDDDDGDDDVLAVTAGMDVKKLVPPISGAVSAPKRRAERELSADGGNAAAIVKDDSASRTTPAATPSRGSEGKTAADARGVKFLSEHRDEIRTARELNRNYFINSDGNVTIGDMPEMCWMQLPRLAALDPTKQQHPQVPGQPTPMPTAPPEHGDELLSGMPAGRIGTLRIHQSGKVSLCIGGHGGRQPVLLDVGVCEDPGDTNPSKAGAPSRNLVAILQQLSGALMDDDVNGAAAVDLGVLGKKLVAMPDFDV